MSRFSFVHAADLHLDSPFVGVTARAPEVAEALRTATFAAFDGVVRACLERRVDFLVVAGDVYDGADRSLRAQLAFRDGLARLAARGIGSFVVHGNHDPLDGWSAAIAWPRGVHVFGASLESVAVERDGATLARVSGISYPRRQEERNLARLFAGEGASGGAPFHLGLLHANVGRQAEHDPYAPCELADLRGRGVDYWALGHVHTRQTLSEAPFAVYPGNTQGRHGRETGERGCVLVEVDGAQVRTEPIAVDAVRWHAADVDIGGIATLDALENGLEEAVAAAVTRSEGRPSICKLRLVGRGSLFRDLRRDGHVDQLLERLRHRQAPRRPFAWIEQLELGCQPELDVEQRRESADLGGELLRVGASWRAGDLRQALTPALAPLRAHPRLAALLDTSDEAALERLLAEAELLCLDRLDARE